MPNTYKITGAIVNPDWEFQKCKGCGHEQRLDYHVSDVVWEKVTKPESLDHHVLCLECFLGLADERHVSLEKKDIIFICVISKTGWTWEY